MQIQKTRTYTDEQWQRKLAWQANRRQELGVIGRCKMCDSPKDSIHSHYCEECKLAMKAEERLRGRLKQYGITPEEYRSLLTKQGGKCAACKTTTPTGRGTWHVDHDHETGFVRGLLCHECNLMAGWMEKHGERIGPILSYLSRF